MKAICPSNPNHKRFVTTVHVSQDWEVDENGDFIAVRDDFLDVTHRPDSGNVWTCLACGTEAVVG